MDGLYNVFLNNSHSTRQEKILTNYNYQVFEHIVEKIKTNKKKLEVLELGVGKGYFAKACHMFSQKNDITIKYSAFDRNEDMLKNLSNIDHSIKTYSGELPNLKIKTNKKFDIVYCAFVVEHLNSGLEVYGLINNIKKVLNKNGMIVFFTPNALKQGYEFYNIDYTHQYPTTARNLTMAFKDCEINQIECLKINGLCTYKHFDNPFVHALHKFIFLFYSYRLFSFLFWPIYRVPLYNLDNFFYKVFCFLKEENLMFMAKVSDD